MMALVTGATGFVGLSSTNLTPGTGAKNITGLAAIGGGACAFADGNVAIAVSRADPTIWFRGPVSSANIE